MHSLLYYSLKETTLHHPHTPSSTTIENINYDHLHSGPFNTSHWIDENLEIFTLAFPAQLNLTDEHTMLTPNNDNHIIFHLSPLSHNRSQDFPTNAINCSTNAMTILEKMSRTVEQQQTHRKH